MRGSWASTCSSCGRASPAACGPGTASRPSRRPTRPGFPRRSPARAHLLDPPAGRRRSSREVAAFRPTAVYGFPSHLKLLARAARAGSSLGASSRRASSSTRRPVADPRARVRRARLRHLRLHRDQGDRLAVPGARRLPRERRLAGARDSRRRRSRRDTGPPALTSLYNSAMPLLRYAMGDSGVLRPGRCRCGRGLPLMEPSRGRTVDYLRLPGGRLVAPYTLTCAIESVPGLRQYQIVQEALDRVRVNVVPAPEFDAGPAAISSCCGPCSPGSSVCLAPADPPRSERQVPHREVEIGGG